MKKSKGGASFLNGKKGQMPSTRKEATSVAAHQEMVLDMVFRKAQVVQRNPSSQPVTAEKYVAPVKPVPALQRKPLSSAAKKSNQCYKCQGPWQYINAQIQICT